MNVVYGVTPARRVFTGCLDALILCILMCSLQLRNVIALLSFQPASRWKSVYRLLRAEKCLDGTFMNMDFMLLDGISLATASAGPISKNQFRKQHSIEQDRNLIRQRVVNQSLHRQRSGFSRLLLVVDSWLTAKCQKPDVDELLVHTYNFDKE